MAKLTTTDNLIAVGKILRTQGNKGELRVMPLTDFPQRFQVGSQVMLEGADYSAVHEITSVRPHNQWLILGLTGINDITTGEKFRGFLLKVPPELLYDLPAGHYYVFQLIGLPVYTQENSFLGELIDVLSTGGNDVYQVVHPETNKEILLPAIKECVQAIDIPNGRIVVKLLPGLTD